MARGKLRIFLGYAAGVGKTYRMLTEARSLRDQGRDLVIGYFEPHGREETIALTDGLEFVPRKVFEYRGSAFEEMDADAVIGRQPEIAVVDEFAHTNAPGSERPKRWQDIRAILDAGIDVLTSLNVQHIESLNDQVWHVTGVRVRETIPDWVVGEADEVVMVDVTPRALLHRLERGVVYPPEKAKKAVENFFTESNLTALRELALRQTAHEVEERREDGEQMTPAQVRTPEPAASAGPTYDRILLWITPDPSTAMLIRRARRVADYLDAPCTAVYCEKDTAAVEDYLNFCRNLHIDARPVCGGDQAKAVAAYARQDGATQVYLTRRTPDLNRLVNLARDMQVTIVAERVRKPPGRTETAV